MKRVLQGSLVVTVAALLFCTAASARAQTPRYTPSRYGAETHPLLRVDDPQTGSDIQMANATEPWIESGPDCPEPGCGECSPGCYLGYADPGVYAGAEYLLIRPHFSEAIAFARGAQVWPFSIQTEGQELQFDYDSSLRALVGYRLGEYEGELRFTYSRFQADTAVSADGTTFGPGEFAVDPFGNVVGVLPVFDPSDARYIPFPGPPFILPAGDFIRTRATVDTNVYDLELIKPILPQNPSWALNWALGVRLADIDQYYESVVTLLGLPFSRGDFSADFIGAGPRLGFEARRHFGGQGRFCLFVNGHGALLLGEYDVRSSNAIPPAGFSASQTEILTRTIPVVETELGAAWRPWDSLNLSAGWLFHAWFDLGTSGGQFGGFFAGADDLNIMSFDGLFLKAEYAF